MARSVNLRKTARGRECQLRVPGVCNFNPETTVLAHYRLAGTCGTGIYTQRCSGGFRLQCLP